jgi:hypothetical protein
VMIPENGTPLLGSQAHPHTQHSLSSI